MVLPRPTSRGHRGPAWRRLVIGKQPGRTGLIARACSSTAALKRCKGLRGFAARDRPRSAAGGNERVVLGAERMGEVRQHDPPYRRAGGKLQRRNGLGVCHGCHAAKGHRYVGRRSISALGRQDHPPSRMMTAEGASDYASRAPARRTLDHIGPAGRGGEENARNGRRWTCGSGTRPRTER